MSLWVNHRDPDPPRAAPAVAAAGSSQAPTAPAAEREHDWRRSAGMVLAAGLLAFGITWALQPGDDPVAATPGSPAVELQQDQPVLPQDQQGVPRDHHGPRHGHGHGHGRGPLPGGAGCLQPLPAEPQQAAPGAVD